MGVNAHALSLVWFQVFCLIVAPCFFALEQLNGILGYTSVFSVCEWVFMPVHVLFILEVTEQ